MKRYWIARGLKFVVFAAVAVVAASAAVMWLWNWVMPVTFGLPEITLGRALGLLVLSRYSSGRVSRRNGSAHALAAPYARALGADDA